MTLYLFWLKRFLLTCLKLYVQNKKEISDTIEQLDED